MSVDFLPLPLRRHGSISAWREIGGATGDTLTWRNGAVTPGAHGPVELSLEHGTVAPFDAYEPPVFDMLSFTGDPAGEARVFIGSLFGQTSPLETRTPVVGAELRIYPGAKVVFVVDESFEHGIVALNDGLLLSDDELLLNPNTIAFVPAGEKTLYLQNTGNETLSALLIGGEPRA